MDRQLLQHRWTPATSDETVQFDVACAHLRGPLLQHRPILEHAPPCVGWRRWRWRRRFYENNYMNDDEPTRARRRLCAAEWYETIAILTLLSCCRGYGADENPDFWTSVISRYDDDRVDNAMWRIASKPFPSFYFDFEGVHNHPLSLQQQHRWLEALFTPSAPSAYFEETILELMEYVDKERLQQRTIDVHVQFALTSRAPSTFGSYNHENGHADGRDDGPSVLSQLQTIIRATLTSAGDNQSHFLPIRLCSISVPGIDMLPPSVYVESMAKVLEHSDELLWKTAHFPTDLHPSHIDQQRLRCGFARAVCAALNPSHALPKAITVGSDLDSLDIGYVSAIAAGLRTSNKQLDSITLQHICDQHSNIACLCWMIYALFHPSSQCRMYELKMEISGNSSTEMFKVICEVMALPNPGKALLGFSEDISKLDRAGAEFPAVETRVRLPASFTMQQPLFPLKDDCFTLEVDWKDQNGEVVLELLALTRDHACVLVPGYGYGWVTRELVLSTWSVPYDVKQPRTVKRLDFTGDIAVFNRLLKMVGQEVVSLRWNYVNASPPNELVLAALSCCPQLKVAQLPSEYLSTLAQACQEGKFCLDALELEKRGSRQFPAVQLHTLLTDSRHPCTHHLRELRIVEKVYSNQLKETSELLVDILEKNKTFTDIQLHPGYAAFFTFRSLAKYDGELLCADAQARQKLAFLSTASRLSREVLKRILRFTGKPARRRVSVKRF